MCWGAVDLSAALSGDRAERDRAETPPAPQTLEDPLSAHAATLPKQTVACAQDGSCLGPATDDSICPTLPRASQSAVARSRARGEAQGRRGHWDRRPAWVPVAAHGRPRPTARRTARQPAGRGGLSGGCPSGGHQRSDRFRQQICIKSVIIRLNCHLNCY